MNPDVYYRDNEKALEKGEALTVVSEQTSKDTFYLTIAYNPLEDTFTP
jgi:hypothetical protein